MQIEINHQVSQLVELVASLPASQNLPTETLNSLLSKINTLLAFLNNSEVKLPDEIMKLIFDIFEELKYTLEKANPKEKNLFSRLKDLFSGSYMNKHLETFITKIDNIYQQIIQGFSKFVKPATVAFSLKRQSSKEEPLLEEVDNELLKYQTGYKKLKGTPEEEKAIEKPESPAPFSLKFVCAAELRQYTPKTKGIKKADPFNINGASTMTIKREDFSTFPLETVMRLSKDHCKIEATKQKGNVRYEITDLSINGIYDLGNEIEKREVDPPKRLQKQQKHPLRHGDRIGILINSAKPDEVLLGFDFYTTN